MAALNVTLTSKLKAKTAKETESRVAQLATVNKTISENADEVNKLTKMINKNTNELGDLMGKMHAMSADVKQNLKKGSVFFTAQR